MTPMRWKSFRKDEAGGDLFFPFSVAWPLWPGVFALGILVWAVPARSSLGSNEASK